MAALSAFHSRVNPLIPNCPLPTLEQAILDACIEFCEQGSAVLRELDPVTAVAGNPEIELDMPPQSRLVRVIGLKINGREVEPRQYFEVDGDIQGLPRVFSCSPEGVVVLHPRPDQDYSVRVLALLKPSRTATAVDDVLLENWADFIASGAMYRLLSMPAAPWANPGAAQAYFNNFRMGVNRSELEYRRQRNTNEMRVQPVRI